VTSVAGQIMLNGSLPVLVNLLESNLLCSLFPEIDFTNLGYDRLTTKSAHFRPEVKLFIAVKVSPKST
jgi:hypothetical protein